MKANNYECGIYDDGEIYIQTEPRQMEANNGRVYLTAGELRRLLTLAENAVKEEVACRNPRARDAGWIVAFCHCDVCTARRAENIGLAMRRCEGIAL
jgi:hypothetical protein